MDTLPDGSFSPCCYFDPSKRYQRDQASTAWDYLESQELQELKESLLRGECPAGCQQCFLQEKKGDMSPRTKSNQRYPEAYKMLQRNPEELKIECLNLRLSNICDLSCRTCNPFCSTSWNKDALALNKDNAPLALNLYRPHSDLEESILGLCKTVSKLYISGGEPFMDPQLPAVLETFLGRDDEERVHIDIQTNLASDRIFSEPYRSLIPKISNLTLSISIDGIGQKAELLRKGMDWSTFESNLKRIQETYPKAKLLFTPTISILNAFHILEMFDYLKDNFKDTPFWLDVNMVNNPLALNPQILEEDSKSHLIKAYDSYIQKLSPESDQKFIEVIEEIKDFILARSFQDQLFNFYGYTKALDKIRDEDTLKIFPELKHPAFTNL